jgi:hypothetical protein
MSTFILETLQILGHASKSLCKPFVHKVRDIALTRTGQFGVSLCFFPIALCLLRSAFHFHNPHISPVNVNSDMGRPNEGDGAKVRLNWARSTAIGL